MKEQKDLIKKISRLFPDLKPCDPITTRQAGSDIVGVDFKMSSGYLIIKPYQFKKLIDLNLSITFTDSIVEFYYYR